MNIAELSIRKSVITWVMTTLLLVMGWSSYNNLSRLEDPDFTIKDAIVITPYPGASAAEVEEEVTNLVEKAIQQMGQVDWIESESTRGRSQIKVHILDKYDKNSLPQVWDELRRKVNDVQRQLPPGAGPSIVNDDFGDVYGVFYAITGEGYSYQEIYEYAKVLQRELLKAKDVKRIEMYGVRQEVIFVEMRREKMAQLGISQEEIYSALAAKNLPATSGYLTLGTEYIPVNPTGEFKSEQEFGDLLISSSSKGSRLIFLKDVATIKRGYEDPPKTIMRYNGKPAIGLGISTVQGGNVITMAESINKRLQELQTQTPLGMKLNVVSHQADAVNVAINGFLVSLAQAVVIVIVVLLIFMGLRSGLIIGVVLLLTIMGTFIFMDMGNVTLERISLGALIIALGMLVDNAIVVTDGMRVKMRSGTDALSAAKNVVGQTAVPLLGATLVAVAAFASIGTSQDATGEYTRTLFYVILISLTLSWLTAVTTTPLLCKTFLKVGSEGGTDTAQKDPYGGAFFQKYKQFLIISIRHRWITIGAVIGLFALSVFGFGYVKKSFFPDSTRPQFYIDFWFPEGTHIEETAAKMKGVEEMLLKREGIKHTTTMVGGGQLRFLLTYTPEGSYGSFAQVLVDVDDYKKIDALSKQLQEEFDTLFSAALVNVRLFILGPSTGGKIQLRISGPDPDVLRQLGETSSTITKKDSASKAVRNEWRSKIKVLSPQMAEAQARRAGISRPDLANAIESTIEGTRVGIYRERDELLPIIARSPKSERIDMDNLANIQVWTPVTQTMIPLAQITKGFKTEFENASIWRRDRNTMLRIHTDQRTGLPSQLFARIKPKIEKALNVDVEEILGRPIDPDKWNASTIRMEYKGTLPLKDMPGYYIAWGGEAEDSARATASLAGSIPVFFGLMVLIVLILFNSIKQTLVIWLTVPLSLIGVTVGLLLLKQPFGFMSLLGLMSLAGMLIKNAIVLVDQINLELASGKQGFQAIVDSGVSRLIPVSMAALTTILGMVPLLKDAFFVSMAVTIMFGLGFATVLTLIVVPVLYAVFFKIQYAEIKSDA